jgi:hypothetical protein
MQSPTAPLNPWVNIWIRPRQTIRQIVDVNPTYFVTLLAMMSGFAQALDRAIERGYGDSIPWYIVIVIALALGSIGGVINIYIMGAILRWMGSKLGGVATSEDVRAAIAWSSLPSIVGLAYTLFFIFILRNDAFTTQSARLEAIAEQSVGSAFLLFSLGILLIVVTLSMGVWKIILLSKMLGEVHGFSAWRGLVTYLIPGTVIAAVVFLVIVASKAIYLGP